MPKKHMNICDLQFDYKIVRKSCSKVYMSEVYSTKVKKKDDRSLDFYFHTEGRWGLWGEGKLNSDKKWIPCNLPGIVSLVITEGVSRDSGRCVGFFADSHAEIVRVALKKECRSWRGKRGLCNCCIEILFPPFTADSILVTHFYYTWIRKVLTWMLTKWWEVMTLFSLIIPPHPWRGYVSSALRYFCI